MDAILQTRSVSHALKFFLLGNIPRSRRSTVSEANVDLVHLSYLVSANSSCITQGENTANNYSYNSYRRLSSRKKNISADNVVVLISPQNNYSYGPSAYLVHHFLDENFPSRLDITAFFGLHKGSIHMVYSYFKFEASNQCVSKGFFYISQYYKRLDSLVINSLIIKFSLCISVFCFTYIYETFF